MLLLVLLLLHYITYKTFLVHSPYSSHWRHMECEGSDKQV